MDPKALKDVRRGNLRRLIDEKFWGRAAAAARAIERPPQQVNDMLSGRKFFGEKIARHIEETLSLPVGYLDAPPNERREVDLPQQTRSTTAGQTSTLPASIEQPEEVEGVVLTKDALDLIRAWWELPGARREAYRRQIMVEALQHSVPAQEKKVTVYAKKPTKPMRDPS
jgi:hypothetical protein